MSDTIIFRAEGTSCVVYCPSEAAGLYIPAQLVQSAGYKGEVLVIGDDAPVFQVLNDAWKFHFQAMQEAVAARHNDIDAQYADALHAVKKKVSSLHVQRLLNGQGA